MTQPSQTQATGEPAPPAEAPAPKPKRSPSVAPRSFRGRLLAGTLIIIPLAVTVMLIRLVYNAALEVGVRLVYWVSIAAHGAFKLQGAPKWIDTQNAEWTEKTVAVVLTVLMLYTLGWLGTNVAGRQLIDFVERLVERIPLVATIYSAIKRMVQSLSGARKLEDGEQQVALIDFPHENMKAIAFVTNVVTDRTTKRKMATVFVPTTPNPTSGYMLIVPVDRLTQVDWSMEEALSIVLSGGATARTDIGITPPFMPSPAAPPPKTGA